MSVHRSESTNTNAMKRRFDNEAVQRFCCERGMARLELFCSALRDDFRPDSDVDWLCTLAAEKDHCGLLEWVDMQLKLAEIFGHPVDLVSRPVIERSRNPYRRKAILLTARPIYAAG
jgi:predicted nucleotidyltransferase